MLVTLLLIVVFFVMAIAGLVLNNIITTINDDIQSSDDYNTDVKAKSQYVNDSTPETLDNIFLMIVVLLWVGALATSFFVDSHPLFLIIAVIGLIAVFLVSMLLGNIYYDLSNDTELATYKTNYPKTTWIMDHILIVIVVMGLTIAGTLYMKEVI